MDWFLICARLLLAAVFLVAAAGKLLDLQGSRRSLLEFGVPRSLITVGAIALPAAELLAAAALVLAPTARVGAVGGLVLLTVFTGGMVGALRRGQAPQCHCFGALHSEPVGAWAIARNVVLAAIAVAVCTQAAQPALGAWFAHHSADQLAILGLSTALAASLGTTGALWQKNRALRKPARVAPPRKPLAVGSPAPAFRTQDVAGRRVSLKSVLNGSGPIALLFLSPGCGSCRSILPDLSRWQVALSAALPIHVVSAAQHEQTREMTAEHQLDRVLVDSRRQLGNLYGIQATPAALIIDAEGRVASPPASGSAAIEALIRRTLGSGQVPA